MKIKTRKDLVRILTEGWKNEVSVNINEIAFLTNMTKISITSTSDGTENNYIAVTDNEGALMCGTLAKNITSIFTNDYYKVSFR